MKLSDKDLDLIQQYLSEALTDEDKSNFDSRLEDTEFKEELLFQSEMIDALGEIDYQNTIGELKEGAITATEPSSTTNNEPVKKGQLGKWLGILGIVAMMLLAGWFGFKDGKASKASHNFAELALDYSTPYPVAQIERGSSTQKEIITDGLAAYANNDWQKAVEAFGKINPQTDKIKMYTANSLIQLKQYQKAKVTLFSLSATEANSNPIKNGI